MKHIPYTDIIERSPHLSESFKALYKSQRNRHMRKEQKRGKVKV